MHPTLDVLIVDDDPDTQTVFSAVLRHYGMTVRNARTEAEAFAAAVERCPDMLILDLRLGKDNGLQVLQRFRSEAGCVGVPVVLVTADIHAGHQIMQEDSLRIATVLIKPIRPVELVDAIRAVQKESN